MGRRSTARRGGLVLALIALLLCGLTIPAALAAPGSAPANRLELAHRTHRCGQIGSSAGWGYGDIRAHGLSCSAARRVIRHWSPDHPHGWTLNQDRSPQVFHKGREWITGYPLGD